MSCQGSPIKRAGLMAVVALFTFVADFASKQWALSHLHGNSLLTFIPNVLGMTLVTNTGTAFGMWRGVPIVGLLLPPAICLAIIYWIVRREMRGAALSAVELVGFGLVLGGAAGNVFDRLVHGQVTDFLFFEFWQSFPVFNVADALIDVGVGLIILHSLLRREDVPPPPEGERKPQPGGGA
jgi:signal peptidase II